MPKQSNWQTVGWIIFYVTLVLLAFYFVLPYMTKSNPSMEDNYWNEFALVNYLTQTRNISYDGGGTGTMHWSEGDKDFFIQCTLKFDRSSAEQCCKEGEVSWGEKYDAHTIKWLNVTRNTC